MITLNDLMDNIELQGETRVCYYDYDTDTRIIIPEDEWEKYTNCEVKYIYSDKEPFERIGHSAVYIEIDLEGEYYKLRKFWNYPVYNQNGELVQYLYKAKVLLKCEKCGEETIDIVEFSNHIPEAQIAFEYEYGNTYVQKNRYWWTCPECGGSEYVKQIIEIKQEVII